MRGDDLPGIIAEWQRLAGAEPDGVRRSTYAALALVFAELAKGLIEWQRALEHWDMKESQAVLGWKREGMLEGEVRATRKALLQVLGARFPGALPDDVRLAVEGTNDVHARDVA